MSDPTAPDDGPEERPTAPAEAPTEAPTEPAHSGDPTAAAAFYSRWAHVYDLVARRTPLVRGLRRRTVAATRLERGDTVVEVGCGTGANLPVLAREVGPTGRVVGVDVSRGAVERARRTARGYPQVDVLLGDARDPPVAGLEGVDDVDAVLATFLVGMLEEPVAAVECWCDLVAPGGHVVLLHLRRSEGRLAPLANAGLEVATRISTPPASQLRYDADLTAVLDRRVRAAHDALRERAAATVTESHVLDLVELTGGRIE